jgi:hypothetical protein
LYEIVFFFNDVNIYCKLLLLLIPKKKQRSRDDLCRNNQQIYYLLTIFKEIKVMKKTLIMLALFLVAFANCFADDPPYDWPCPEDMTSHPVYKGIAIIGDPLGCHIVVEYCCSIDYITGGTPNPGEYVQTNMYIYINNVYYAGDCSGLPSFINENGELQYLLPTYEEILNAVAGDDEMFGIVNPKPCSIDPNQYSFYAKIYSGVCQRYVHPHMQWDDGCQCVREIGGYYNCNPGEAYYCVSKMIVCKDYDENGLPFLRIVEEIPGEQQPECEGDCKAYCFEH